MSLFGTQLGSADNQAMKKSLVFVLLMWVFCVPNAVVFGQLPALSGLEEHNKIVKAIEVQGNKSIGMATILSKIKTRVGQEYVQSVISDDLKRLYNTGYFADVSVDRQDYEGGFKVIFTLVEKPIIERITFSKTRHIHSRSILGKIESKEGKFLDNKVLRDDVEIIKDLYAKRGLTKVEVGAEPTIDRETNKAKLHFVIKEGGRIKIRKINVYGNKAFREKTLVRVMQTRSAWLFNSGFLKEDVLKEDMERLMAFYEKEGFIDAKARYDLDYGVKGRLLVNVHIEEGKQYFIEDVVITGNEVLSLEDIQAVIKDTKAGLVFSRDKLSVDVSEIQSLYFDKGYIFARVSEATSLNPETGQVNVKLDIQEGNLAYVNKIKIQGNTRTRDIVIRRELRLLPGDQFDGAKLRRSKERLKNLEYFEDINYDIEDTDSPEKKDLVVLIKEAKTGTLSFGGGFSTIDQFIGFIEIEQKNFDFANWPTFTGGGQNLILRAETGSLRNNLRLSFTEPWLFDYPISAGFDVFRFQRDKERDTGYTFDEVRAGGDMRFGKQFTEYISAGMIYKLENIKVENFDEGVSADLKAEEGENTISLFGTTITRDSRDSVISPTRGLYLSSDFDVAGGALGGDKDFYRIEPRASYYIPLKFSSSVIEFRVRTGIVDAYGDSQKVPIFERYFLGGARTVRGYGERKIGPIDPVTEDPIGGEAMFVSNIEYVIPIIDFIKFATFLDTGNIWTKVSDFGEGSFKSGAGVGFRFKTPIGPINLDYGYPLNDEPGEEERSGKFYFSVSRGF